ncbi:MAG: hypothetical protein KAT58_07615 [candidate division Zixibacteria bacterium]|nr:hypothetical protein [candidate division Zixibacteria bacterium]
MILIRYYKILGVTLFAGCLAVAVIVQTSLDLKSVTTSNDFITAILHSDGVVGLFDRFMLYLALFIAIAGFGIGSFCFGIGEILAKLDRENHSSD